MTKNPDTSSMRYAPEVRGDRLTLQKLCLDVAVTTTVGGGRCQEKTTHRAGFCQLSCCCLLLPQHSKQQSASFQIFTTAKRSQPRPSCDLASSMTEPEASSSLQPRKLTFSIHSVSSVSQTFHADNVLEDRPFDQSSRYQSCHVMEVVTSCKWLPSSQCNVLDKAFCKRQFQDLVSSRMFILIQLYHIVL